MSDIHPVPDHQEVFMDSEADQALIFEIVVRRGEMKYEQRHTCTIGADAGCRVRPRPLGEARTKRMRRKGGVQIHSAGNVFGRMQQDF